MTTTFRYQHTIETAASPQALWRLYADVATWPRWDEAFERVTLDGAFAPGTTGTMTVRGQDPLPFRLVDVEPEVRFVDETTMPDGVIRFAHSIEARPDGRVRLTHAVEIDGPEPFSAQVGPMITAGVPDTMRSLAAMAEAQR